MVSAADAEPSSPTETEPPRCLDPADLTAPYERPDIAIAGRGTDPAEPAFGVYTSGSTGVPKGIGFSQRQMGMLVTDIERRLRYRDSDIVLCALPLAFDYGYYQILLSVLAGSHLVLAAGGATAVNPRLLASKGVTVLPVVPTLLRAYLLAARTSRSLPPLRLVTNTGERMPAPLQSLLAEAHPDVELALMYGLSECKRVSIGVYPAADLPRPDVGTPIPSARVAIHGPGGPVAPGEYGEIVVRGPAISRLDLERTTATSALDDVPELRTGDFGRLDAEGLLYVEGRSAELLKINGVRASRAEIERAAEQAPGALQACVGVGADGEVTLWLVGSTSPTELFDTLARHLDSMKIPASRRIVDRLPVNANGKVSPNGSPR